MTKLREPQSELKITHCTRCFITGKSCSYEELILARLQQQQQRNLVEGRAFVIMPFSKIMDELYHNQLLPWLTALMHEGANRADEVRSAGYIMCEKICKQIQEAQIVFAELSTDNSNVLYELGLAVGLDKPVVLLVQASILPERSRLLGQLGLTSEDIHRYDPFSFLRVEDFNYRRNPFRRMASRRREPAYDHSVLPGRVLALLADTGSFCENVSGTAFEYPIDQICESVICASLNNIVQSFSDVRVVKFNGKRGLDGYVPDLLSQIEAADCIIVCTSEREPISYFLLGYSHALGKKTIPITAVGAKYYSDGQEDPRRSAVSANLPFDVRALWHIHFGVDTIEDLRRELKAILAIVLIAEEHGNAIPPGSLKERW